MSRLYIPPALALCVLATSLAASHARADIYKYEDKEGVVHFTNIRPRGAGWRVAVRTPKRRPELANVNTTPSGQATLGAERFTLYDPHIREASSLYNIPEPLIRAVMTVESNFHVDAVSQVGALGLMQLMPATAARMGVSDPFNPRENVPGGARYLRHLADLFKGDLSLTLAAYNAGEGAVQKYNGIPPYAETQRYVQNVIRHYLSLRLAPPPLDMAAVAPAAQ